MGRATAAALLAVLAACTDPVPGGIRHVVLVSLDTTRADHLGCYGAERVRTPFLTRNPYLFGDSTWGLVYVSHGIAGVSLVGLVIAHVYFAVRPEKWWITKSMILGWITRRQYLEHHDPDRWAIRRSEGSAVQ